MKTKIILIISITIIMFNSCGKFGDTNVSPNKPDKYDTRFLFTRAMQGTTFAVYSSAPAPSSSTFDVFSQLYPQYFAEIKNIQFTQFGNQDFSTSPYYITFLKNLEQIIRANKDPKEKEEPNITAMGDSNNQIAVAMTLEAFYYMHLTDILGSINYSEFSQEKDGKINNKPKYDTQEYIYSDLDKKLNEAYGMFDESKSFDELADILYNGDISKWKRLNASIRMLLAIKLSDVDSETGKQRFKKAFEDNGIENIEDNLKYEYLHEQDNMNPLHENVVISGRQDFGPSKTIIDTLIEYKDPRILSYAIPNPNNDFDAMPFGVSRGDINKYAGKIALFNPKLYEIDAPITIISSSRILLVEAEAAVRGWINANPEELYKKGIAESFKVKDFNKDIEKYKAQNPDALSHIMSKYNLMLTPEEYVSQPKIALSGSQEEKIEKIAMQRWVGGFLENGLEAWSDWRRLNVPKLFPGEAARGSIKHIPYRRTYSSGDYESNIEEYNKALQKQGPNTFDTRLWWDTKDNN